MLHLPQEEITFCEYVIMYGFFHTLECFTDSSSLAHSSLSQGYSLPYTFDNTSSRQQRFP